MKTHQHRFRDLVQQYLSAQPNGQMLSVRQARELLDRGLTLQREPDDNLNRYIANPKKTLPCGVPLPARIVENQLLAAIALLYLHNVPLVTQYSRLRETFHSWCESRVKSR